MNCVAPCTIGGSAGGVKAETAAAVPSATKDNNGNDKKNAKGNGSTSANTGTGAPAPGSEGAGQENRGFWQTVASGWEESVSSFKKPWTVERAVDGLEALPVGKVGARPMNLMGKLGQWINGCCCFPAGTPVATEFGMIPIEEIRVGQLVYARDLATGETKLKPVTQLMITKAKP